MNIIPSNRFLKVLNKQSVDRTPIWLMRQAGRYLPEYRATRQKAGSFLKLCKTPDLAMEVTLQPLQRYPLDAAIIFSDILTIPDAMGCELYFVEGEGPKFAKPVRTLEDIHNLRIPTMDLDAREASLGYVAQAIKLTVNALDSKIPLIGFCGSPWTVATYMVEGSASKTFSIIKKMMYEAPEQLHLLLEKLTQASIAYLKSQILAGAQTVMIFDSWGGVLSTPCYQAFSLEYMQKIVNSIKEDPTTQVPVILFTKNGNQWLESMALTGCDALGLDWTIPLGQARARVGSKVVLQGNCDPAILFANKDKIREEVAATLASFGRPDAHSGHIFNLGHGLLPNLDPGRVEALIQAVIELSPQYYL